MKEKRIKKISAKTTILIIFIILLVVFIAIESFVHYRNETNKTESVKKSSSDFYETQNLLKEENVVMSTGGCYHRSDYVAMFISGFLILCDIVIGVSINVFNHNKKCDSISSDNKKKEMIRETIVEVATVLLVLALPILSIVFATSQDIVTYTAKPIIYLYPTEDTEVSVKLKYKNNITCSYPKYTNGWKVLAKTNGDLVDLDTGKNLYSLYYESENVVDYKVEKDGFIVKGEDASEFLEEKLDVLGLTEREAEEFIIYWLPKLESNKYNYIRFATIDEINENMPLEINPNPDTLIRVIMTFKGLEQPIEVQEQQLEAPDRTGFVVVEWGGTEIQ